MKKLVDFVINENSTIERLDPVIGQIDIQNGPENEYLGMIRFGDVEIMVTRKSSSNRRSEFKGEIVLTEIEFDTYADGEIVLYYNADKSDALVRLQHSLNHPLILKQLDEGMALDEVLYRSDISVGPSAIEGKVQSCFYKSSRFVYPDDYDFNRSYLEGSREAEAYDRKHGVKENPVEYTHIFGIPNELFQNLRQVKRYSQMSAYTMALYIRKLEEQKERSR